MNKLLLAFVVGLLVTVAPHASADTMTVVSDTGVLVYGPLYAQPSGLDDAAWGSSASAVAAWVHWRWPSISGATWVSTAYLVESPDPASWRKFHVDLDIPSGAYNIAATLQAAADNAEEVYLNGNLVGSNSNYTVITTYPISPTAGTNSLDFIVVNAAYPGGVYANPTGLLFKVVITYDVALEVAIDIKPGSDPNATNLGSAGVIPVAILGSDVLDVHDIDQESLALAGNAAKRKGKKQKIGAFEDVNGDGYPDLVVHFPTEGVALGAADTEASVTGNLADGTPITGSDSVKVVPAQ